MSGVFGFDWSICKRCYNSGPLVKVSANKVRCMCCGASYTLADAHHVTESKDSGKQNKDEEDCD